MTTSSGKPNSDSSEALKQLTYLESALPAPRIAEVDTHDAQRERPSSEMYGNYLIDDENQLQCEDTLVDCGVSDALDEGYSPPDRIPAAR